MRVTAIPYPTDESAPRLRVLPAADAGGMRVAAGQSSASRSFEQAFSLVGPLTGLAPGWLAHRDLPLKLRRDLGGSWIVAEDVFLVYGVGETPEEALRDYLASLVEYYHLVETGAQQDEHDKRELDRLRGYLEQLPLP